METPFFETLLVIAVFALWFLFPLGLFLSVGQVDKTTTQRQQTTAPNPTPAMATRTVASGHRPFPSLGQFLLYLRWRFRGRLHH